MSVDLPSANANNEGAPWVQVHYPIVPSDTLPAERKVVAVWCAGEQPNTDRGVALPYLGYLRYAAGDPFSPYFVVYHGNSNRPTDVIAWCDCLPTTGPKHIDTRFFEELQPSGRGFPQRPSGEFDWRILEWMLASKGE